MNNDEKEAEEYFWKYLKETFPLYDPLSDDFDYGDFEFKLLEIFKLGIEHGHKGYIKLPDGKDDIIAMGTPESENIYKGFIKAEKAIVKLQYALFTIDLREGAVSSQDWYSKETQELYWKKAEHELGIDEKAPAGAKE